MKAQNRINKYPENKMEITLGDGRKIESTLSDKSVEVIKTVGIASIAIAGMKLIKDINTNKKPKDK